LIDFFEILKNNFLLQIIIVIYIGLVFGSLLNVIISRMIIMENVNLSNLIINNTKSVSDEVKDTYEKYKNYSLFKPKSNCPKCNSEIKWYQNIPILSYIFLKGKCAFCKTKISIEYPLVELITTIGFIMVFLINGFNLETFLHISLFYFLLAIFIIDFKEKIIFDSLNLIVFSLCSFIFLINNDYNLLGQNLIGAIFIYFSIFLFIYFWESLRGKGQMFGRGDIKLIAALTMLLGWQGSFSMLILSCVIGILLFISLTFFSKAFKILDSDIPFGPSIIISFYITYIFEINLFLLTQ
tara:strand:+ start:122734 stop:123621 length:888 start_codon:yes stop_codon:yes gene_type:complete